MNERYKFWGNLKSQTPEFHEVSQSWAIINYDIIGEAKPSHLYQTQSSVSSLPQWRSQAVMCIYTPRMYLRSSYFVVFKYFNIHYLKEKYCTKS